MEYFLKKLNERKTNNNLRSLQLPKYDIDFFSNDYLGLQYNNQVAFITKEIRNGYQSRTPNGSRLISGNSELKEDFEGYLAQKYNAESALLFNSGYNANTGLLGSISDKEALILFDEKVHASIREGLRLSLAKTAKFQHNDFKNAQQLVDKLKEDYSSIYLVIESVYSMNGDQPNWTDLSYFLSENPQVHLIVDEAHGVGVLGENGLGASVEFCKNIKNPHTTILTFGKAIGSHGAAIIGSKIWKEYLINFSKPFIYTTALPDAWVAKAWAAFFYLEESRVQTEFNELVQYFVKQVEIKNLGDFVSKFNAAIQIFRGVEKEQLQKTETVLKNSGIGIKAIYEPTVAKDEECIRISLHHFNNTQQIDTLLNHISKAVL